MMFVQAEVPEVTKLTEPQQPWPRPRGIDSGQLACEAPRPSNLQKMMMSQRSWKGCLSEKAGGRYPLLGLNPAERPKP